MVAPSTTIWELEPHTRAKHEILRSYLARWMPIMIQGGFDQLLYIDGFAGPGEYVGGHEGSPVIALKTMLATVARVRTPPKHALFYFVEKDGDRAAHLQTRIDALDLPSWCRTKVKSGAFADAFAELLAWYDGKGKTLPPTFAFIDPFGWAGVPFQAVRDVMRFPSCEVFVNFMYEEVNRFLALESQAENFDAFFGTGKWRDAVASATGRNRALHDLYASQLRDDASATYVRSFQMRNDKDVVDYYLFHATRSLKGLKVMKEAMWKVDATGEFTFSDATDPGQLVLLGAETHDDLLQRLLRDRFAGQTVPCGEIERFVVEETAFRESHYKKVLRLMELATPALIDVPAAPPSRKRGTYPSATMQVRFL